MKLLSCKYMLLLTGEKDALEAGPKGRGKAVEDNSQEVGQVLMKDLELDFIIAMAQCLLGASLSPPF